MFITKPWFNLSVVKKLEYSPKNRKGKSSLIFGIKLSCMNSINPTFYRVLLKI